MDLSLFESANSDAIPLTPLRRKSRTPLRRKSLSSFDTSSSETFACWAAAVASTAAATAAASNAAATAAANAHARTASLVIHAERQLTEITRTLDDVADMHRFEQGAEIKPVVGQRRLTPGFRS